MKAHSILLSMIVLAPWAMADDPAGSSLRFDGVDDVATVPFSASLDVRNAFTLEAWVFPANNDSGGIAGMWGWGGFADKMILYLSAGNVVGRLSREGKPFHDTVSAPLAAGTWTHVALRYDGSDLDLVLNGTEVATIAVPGIVVSTPVDLRFGVQNITAESFSLAGQLDEVRLWSIARTDHEILLDRGTCYTTATDGLVGAWSFNESGPDQIVLDASGQGNDGFLGTGAGMDASDPARQDSSAPIAWRDLGFALEGSSGQPVLRGVSTMKAGGRSYLELRGARPMSSVALVVGFQQANAPLLGGVLVPSTDAVVMGLPTDGAGQLILEFHWPAALQFTPGYFQAWILDPESPLGFSASNGLEANRGLQH